MKKVEVKELWKFITEFNFFLLGSGIESGKEKKWQGWLFALPFLAVLGILMFLVVRVFIS